MTDAIKSAGKLKQHAKTATKGYGRSFFAAAIYHAACADSAVSAAAIRDAACAKADEILRAKGVDRKRKRDSDGDGDSDGSSERADAECGRPAKRPRANGEAPHYTCTCQCTTIPAALAKAIAEHAAAVAVDAYQSCERQCLYSSMSSRAMTSSRT